VDVQPAASQVVLRRPWPHFLIMRVYCT